MVEADETPVREPGDFREEYRSVRTLVTGASGFIGRWVSGLLSRAGAELVLAVRDPARMSTIAREHSIEGELITVDLREKAALESLVRKVRPSVIFNLAGYGVDPGETGTREARTMNCDVPRWLAASVARSRGKDWGGAHLVHAGSALEYGTAGGNLHEDGPAMPTTEYGKSKLAGTMTLMSDSGELGLETVVARLFTVYGPGEHPDRLLPSLMKAAERQEPIALTSGAQKRDFTFVRDAAEGLLRIGQSAARQAGIVNLATGRLTRVRDFVEAAAPILGIPPARLEFGAKLDGRPEMQHDPVSIRRLRDLTGWEPATSIAEGITMTVSHRSVAA